MTLIISSADQKERFQSIFSSLSTK